MAKHSLKIMRCKHNTVFNVCLAIARVKNNKFPAEAELIACITSVQMLFSILTKTTNV